MKSFFTFALLLLLSLVARPAAAASPDPQRATPTRTKAHHCSARQLVHYLSATLQLSATQTLAVQQALKVNPLHVRNPEQITQRLQAVLTPDEFDHLTALTNNAVTYEYLSFLAVR